MLRGAVTEAPGDGGDTHFQASVQSRGLGASWWGQEPRPRAGQVWRGERAEERRGQCVGSSQKILLPGAATSLTKSTVALTLENVRTFCFQSEIF